MNKGKVLKTLELLATVGFAAGYFMYDLYVATIVLMAMLTLLVVTAKLMGEALSKLQFFSWIVVVLFGGATVLLKDQVYIKWKPTIINGCLAIALLASHWIGKKTIVERLLGEHLEAPVHKFRRLNLFASLYTVLLASLNLLIAYQFSEAVWVNFKVFGLFILNMAFFIGGYMYLAPYVRAYFEQQQAGSEK